VHNQQHPLLFQIKMVDQVVEEILVELEQLEAETETEEVFHPLKETVEEMEHTTLH
tara:strand:- start:245 stop:412 length:168 start_codon:yes stop_codon:yes gene_type:complete